MSVPGPSSLAGRTVLVTGANRGIGAELVRGALARGADSVVAAARRPAALPDFNGDGRVVPLLLDVRSPEHIRAAAAAHRDVDLLILNAGVSCFRPVLGTDGDADDADDADGADADEQAFAEAMDVNYLGPLRLVRAFAENLRRPGAGAVFVLSVGAVALSRSSPVYSASKAAALMVALALREELRGSGGRVTVVLPGFVATTMSAALQMPKASPVDVAARILDGWSAGDATVWPDAFAEAVRTTVGVDYERLLDEPRTTMTALQQDYARSFGDPSS